MDIEGFLRRTGKKQKELAEELGISVGMVQALKTGRSSTTLSVCSRLLLAGMTVRELFGDDVWEAVKTSSFHERMDNALSDSECREIVERGLFAIGGARERP